MQREIDPTTGSAPACGCTETHVRSRKLAFLKVDLPVDRIAAEKIADGVRDVAQALWVLHENLGRCDEAALITVLAERLECEVEALDAFLAMEVMVEDTGAEEPEAAAEPNLSLRLAPEAGG
jgi:hypothetical protein